MNGYVLVEKEYMGVNYKAVVKENALILFLESVPIKYVDAWTYDKESAEALLCLELAQQMLNVKT